MAKKVMKLIDKYTGEMECQECGSRHFASLKPVNADGKNFYYRGSWQCQYGCKLEEK